MRGREIRPRDLAAPRVFTLACLMSLVNVSRDWVNCGYVLACLLDEPRDVSHVAAMSSSYWLNVSMRSISQDFGLQLHSWEAPNRCRVQTVTERVQNVTGRVQTVTGSRLLLRGSETLPRGSKILLRGFRVQQLSFASLSYIVFATLDWSRTYLDLVCLSYSLLFVVLLSVET
jgi:hypothetical protein